MSIKFKKIAAIGLLMAMAACSTSSPATHSTTVVESGTYVVRGVNVNVPRTLSVSEANTINPRADIVWREDPIGDRYAQVESVLRQGIQAGAAAAKGTQPVTLDVQLIEFHAQSDKVRYSYGGRHELRFFLTIRDANTGDVLVPAYEVNATFDAYGGDEAIIADRQGITQRSRIVQHLAAAVAAQL